LVVIQLYAGECTPSRDVEAEVLSFCGSGRESTLKKEAGSGSELGSI